MDKIKLEYDIAVFYVQAESFPGGIEAAHKKLHSLIPVSDDRKYFGLSRPEKGTIIYKAAAEEISPGEAEKYDCRTLVIRKGNYNTITVKNFMENIKNIGKSFETLLSYPETDPEGYCVEWYFNDKDVKCMVRLADKY